MEIREHYNNLLQKIDKLGPIEKVVNDKEKVSSVIAYSGDRHLLCAFIDRVNEGIESGLIKDGNLAYLRSNEFMDSIVNLKNTVRNFSNRDLYEFEIIDKINYVTLLNDTETLITAFTHPSIIDAMSAESDKSDLSQLKSYGVYYNLPEIVKLHVISKLLKTGDSETASNLLEKSLQTDSKTRNRR